MLIEENLASNELAKTLATAILVHDEGEYLIPYRDHLGLPTIGIGARIKDSSGKLLTASDPLPKMQITKTQSRAQLAEFLESYITDIQASAITGPAYYQCSPLRRAVLLSMRSEERRVGKECRL